MSTLLVLGIMGTSCDGDRTEPRGAGEPQPTFSPAALHAYEQAHPWRAREELLDLCSWIVDSSRSDEVLIGPDSLGLMASEGRGFLPLSRCRQVRLGRSGATIDFLEPVTVSIPNSYGQVSLALSQSLSFSLNERHVGRLEVLDLDLVAGHVDVVCSSLADREGEFGLIRSLKARRLIYAFDREAKASWLLAEGITPVARVAVRDGGSSLMLSGTQYPSPAEVLIAGDQFYIDARAPIPEQVEALGPISALLPTRRSSAQRIIDSARKIGSGDLPGGLEFMHVLAYDLEQQCPAGGVFRLQTPGGDR
jgi:hypothetical protein